MVTYVKPSTRIELHVELCVYCVCVLCLRARDLAHTHSHCGGRIRNVSGFFFSFHIYNLTVCSNNILFLKHSDVFFFLSVDYFIQEHLWRYENHFEPGFIYWLLRILLWKCIKIINIYGSFKHTCNSSPNNEIPVIIYSL